MLDIIDTFREKIVNFGEEGKGGCAIVALFGIKITIDYRPKKSKKCSIVFAF